MPSPSLDLASHIAPQPQLDLEAELGASRATATLPAKAPPAPSLPRRAAERARGFARGPGLVALVTGVVFVAFAVALALLIARDVAAQDYAAGTPVGGGAVAPPGADPVYFVWMAIAQAATGALALLVAWVQAGSKTKDAKIEELERQREARDEQLAALRERAYTAEATLKALEAVRSGELPIMPPPASSPPGLG